MIDEIDIELLNIIQNNFPITLRPYKSIAEILDISEEDVLNRIKKLKDEDKIRKIGVTFNSKQLGYKSTLCALTVPADRLDEVAEIINSYEGVTHNYVRKHKYNVWFTLIAPSIESLQCTIEEIRMRIGINQIMNLSSQRVFKIKVDFKL